MKDIKNKKYFKKSILIDIFAILLSIYLIFTAISNWSIWN